MKLEESIYKKTNQISTGRRIQQPSDDPVGTARAMDFRSRSTEILQYIDNSEQAISWLNCTDDALMTLTNYLQRVRELVIAGANGTLTVEAREAYANEIDAIRDGIMQVANTNIDNRFIFGGERYLNPPYQNRTKVTGDAVNFQVRPIVITDRNNMIDIKLDNGEFVTIRLTPKTYDGSPGNTLDDLANDIQLKLHYAGFDTPVYVKATPDNRLEFYAGTYPSDGIHTLVLRDGPAIKEVGKALSVTPPLADNQIALVSGSSAIANYYNGWQIRIIDGTGAGQIRTITGYTPGPPYNIAEVDSDWGIQPDNTSKYQILPPFEGSSAVATGGNTITLSPASDVPDFFVGMEIEIYDEKRGIYESHVITGYDEGMHEVTIGDTWGVTGNFKYRIKPHLEGQAVSFGANSIQLEASASMIDDFYVGASITVTNPDGSTETKLITGYEYDDTATPPTYTITVKGNWTTNVTAGSTYKISDTALAQLGFDNKATTKELLGYEVEPLIKVLAKYPETGMVQNFTAPQVVLDGNASNIDGYYDNWTIKIIEPSGAVYMDRLTNYDGATRTGDLTITVTPGAKYELVPPLDGEVVGIPAADQIEFDINNISHIDGFYVGMPITITDGNGKSQTRIIKAYEYDEINGTAIATLDSAWGNPPPTAGSKYSIDAHYYINANNKFQIKVGNELTQEISLDGGSYNIREFARMIEEKIQARGGEYANVRVEATPDNRLRIFHQDELNNPLSITLFSGTEADALWIMGFANGISSDTETPNYEGNKGYIEYEISTSMEIQINVIGDKLFDPIFQHLTKISQDLRSNNIEALSGKDLYNIRLDIDKVLVTQGEVGAKVNRLEKGIDRLKSLNENLTRLLSNVEDVDITQAIMELMMQQTAYQAALQSAGRILPMTLLDYLR